MLVIIDLGNRVHYPSPIPKIRTRIGQTIPGSFKGREWELLGDDAHIEVNQAGAGDIDPDFNHRKPQKQILGGDTGEAVDLAVAETAGDIDVVVQFVLELGITGSIQVNLELARIIQAEVVHPFGE